MQLIEGSKKSPKKCYKKDNGKVSESSQKRRQKREVVNTGNKKVQSGQVRSGQVRHTKNPQKIRQKRL